MAVREADCMNSGDENEWVTFSGEFGISSSDHSDCM